MTYEQGYKDALEKAAMVCRAHGHNSRDEFTYPPSEVSKQILALPVPAVKESEPVAWRVWHDDYYSNGDGAWIYHDTNYDGRFTPLYLHPAPDVVKKRMTFDEWWEASWANDMNESEQFEKDIARSAWNAAIAAEEE